MVSVAHFGLNMAVVFNHQGLKQGMNGFVVPWVGLDGLVWLFLFVFEL